MEAQLRAFLDECRISKGEPFTHTTKSTGSLENGWSSGSYFIENDYIDDFWILYCNLIRKGVYPTITECPEFYGPLRVDFDFKSPLETGMKRKYTIEHLKKIVEFYQKELIKIVDESAFDEKLLWCIVLEKPSPRVENGEIKDGFHLHFPHFICEGWIQDEYLRGRVTKLLVDSKLFNQKEFDTPIDKFIDTNIARKPWMLYGSMNYKNNKSRPYMYNRWLKTPPNERYGYMFDHNQKEIHPEKMFEDEMTSRKNTVKYYLPRFLSIKGCKESSIKLVTEIEKQRDIIHISRKKKRKIVKTRSMEDILTDIKTIKDGEIMDMLSDDRASSYESWIDVGWTLFNIGQGCDEALELWKEFSMRWPKFVEGECEKLWETMELRGKTIGSLLAMARTDSPDEYRQWKESNIRSVINSSLYEEKPNEADIAKVVLKMYGDKFICADPKKDLWYEFRDHRWRYMNGGVALRKIFLNDIVEKYASVRKEIADTINEMDHNLALAEKKSDTEKEITDNKKGLLDRKKRCTNIITALKTQKFHTQLMYMCKLGMYNENFLKVIDENRSLLGCENGVIDLDLLIFRDGRPDDYITLSTGQYFHIYNKNDEEVKELDVYLEKVFPNQHLRDYFLDFMCSCMKGGNVHKRFLVLTGDGDNAKTVTTSILENTFGSGNYGYFGKFPRELIVMGNSSSSSGAKPELARVRGKRIMGLDEIAKNEKINIGILKKLTGNDSFFVRNLYEIGTEVSPMFALLLQCNEPPKIPEHDEATWNRIRILDFESKFVKPQDIYKFPVPKSHEEQMDMKRFKADPYFMKKIPDIANVLLWKLFERFKIYKTKGLHEPKEVLLSTENYKSHNDIYLEFIKECIEKETDPKLVSKTSIRLVDISSEFREWYRQNHPSYAKTNMIGRNMLKHELNKRLGLIKDPKTDLYGFGKQNRWWGYKIIQQEGDDTEGDNLKDLL